MPTRQKNDKIETDNIMSPSSIAVSILRKEIKSGKYPIGQRLSNERLLGAQFNISRGTVRKILDILEQERLVVRQQGRGTFVATPSSTSLDKKDVSMIGILVYMKEIYFNKIVDRACVHAANNGFMITIGLNATANAETEHVKAFINHGVQGVIIAPMLHSQVAYKSLTENNIPVVMIDTMLPDVIEDFVSVDNRQGTFLATKHLVELGHSRISYVGHNNPNNLPCKRERIAGFEAACERFGIKLNEDSVIELDDAMYKPGLEALLKKPNRPTAVVTFNDDWARRIVLVAKNMGLKVPEDISVTGFDDASFSKFFEVPLTTVRPDFDEIGTKAINLLIERINSPKASSKVTILISPTLVIRESTTHPKNT